MIVLVIVRRAVCEVCGGFFDLEPEEKPPDQCRLCGSEVWMYGPNSRESTWIRQGIQRAKKALDPGAKSRKRQARGKAQFRQFKSKEEYDANLNAKRETTDKRIP